MGDEYNREVEAPFNMAIATLKRLDAILTQITHLNYMFPLDSVEKQKAYMNLVKQFYINATPLIGDGQDEDMEKVKEDILKFQIESKNNVRSGVQRRIYIFSGDKEKQLDELLIKIQIKLKRYFMPRGKDPSKAVHFK